MSRNTTPKLWECVEGIWRNRSVGDDVDSANVWISDDAKDTSARDAHNEGECYEEVLNQ
jgi:uncharacterized Fe-S cluster-containing MiaB family protein